MMQHCVMSRLSYFNFLWPVTSELLVCQHGLGRQKSYNCEVSFTIHCSMIRLYNTANNYVNFLTSIKTHPYCIGEKSQVPNAKNPGRWHARGGVGAFRKRSIFGISVGANLECKMPEIRNSGSPV